MSNPWCLALLVPVSLGLAACPRRAAERRAPDRGALKRTTHEELVVRDLGLAGPAGRRDDGRFMPGEVVTCLFTVAAFRHQKGKVNLRADLRVEGPEGQVVIDQTDLELLRGPTSSQRPGTIRGAAKLRLSPAAPPGKQTLLVRVRDLIGGGSGSARTELTLVGATTAREDHLRLGDLRWAAGDETPPGGVLPAVFQVLGIATRKLAARGHEIDLLVRSRLEGPGGRTLARHEEPLFRGMVSFAPDAYPFEHQLAVPEGTAPGAYQAVIEIKDRISDVQIVGRLPLKVVPPSFGIWNLHLHDASGLSRQSFLLGEQTFVRFAVFGLRTRDQKLDATVDLAVAGPDRGVYLARQQAVTSSGEASRPFARAGRLPAQLPLVLPSLAPVGRYRVVLRARDRLTGKETVTEQSFTLSGTAPARLSHLTVTDLEVRDRPDLPPGKGDTFTPGRSYELNLVLGGLEPKELRQLTFAISVEAGLQLRSLGGVVVHEGKRLFSYRRELSYQPLRLQVPATWRVPVGLAPGLYDLEVNAVDPQSDRVSQFRRRVELLRAPPPLPVQP